MSDTISFLLNGQKTDVSVRPDTTVLDILRTKIGLKGTKEGCAEGDCGACTILLKRKGINGGKANAANSCIMTAAQIDGAELITVEGLEKDGVLSVLQEAMAENGSSQCGFCTPGIAVALTGLLAGNAVPSENDIHDALAGNLCRCTGYRPIVEAAQKAIGKIQIENAVEYTPEHSDILEIDGAQAHRPNCLDDLLALRSEMPDAHILAGGTDLGVARAGYETDWAEIILIDHVEELRTIDETDAAWIFGAAVTWQEVLEEVAGDLPSFATLIRRFGSTQIRSMGTIGGNIGTASPIGDGPPALIALGASIRLASSVHGMSEMLLEDFFLDYRKTALPEGGVIVSLTIPKPKADEAFRVYKISKRYDQDISTVCGAFWLKTMDGKIADCRLAYGGMAAIPKRAKQAENALIGATMDEESAVQAGALVLEDLTPLSDWRGSADYRARIASGLLLRLVKDLDGDIVEVMAHG